MTFDFLAYQKRKRKENGNAYTYKYEKTIKGFLMRLYRNMDSRINGIQATKAHLYQGKYLLPREEFYEWALGSPEFYQLFGEYKAAGFERALAPSVDRIDSAYGYTTNNMEWVTMRENSRRGAVSRHSK